MVGSALSGGPLSRTLRLAIHLLFLLSGATALVYQVTWLRDLSLVFGASFEATSIVLAAFMAGLSAGGFAFARRSSHRSGRSTHSPIESLHLATRQ